MPLCIINWIQNAGGPWPKAAAPASNHCIGMCGHGVGMERLGQHISKIHAVALKAKYLSLTKALGVQQISV